MDWIPSPRILAGDPRTKRLMRRLSLSLPEAIGYLHLFWWFVVDYAPGGDLAEFWPDDLADAMGWPGDPVSLMGGLVYGGFIAVGESDSYQLVGPEWQGIAAGLTGLAKKRVDGAGRQARYKERLQQAANASVTEESRVTNDTREDKRREDKTHTAKRNSSSNPPDPPRGVDPAAGVCVNGPLGPPDLGGQSGKLAGAFRDAELIRQLVALKVGQKKAVGWVRFNAPEVARQLEYLPFQDDVRNPARFLNDAIASAYGPPPRYLEAHQKREKSAQTAEEDELKRQAQERQEKVQQEELARVDAIFDAMTPEDLQYWERLALLKSPWLRKKDRETAKDSIPAKNGLRARMRELFLAEHGGEEDAPLDAL